MKRISLFIGLLLFAVCSLFGAEETAPLGKIPPSIYHRTVFLGDSITDGDTYPKLVRQAMADAGLAKMIAINAGIGGDTAKGMLARLERDVLVYHPTLVTLSVGANDALRKVSAESYEKDVRAIADRLGAEKIPLIVLTPNIVGPKYEKGQAMLDVYERILRKIAGEQGLRVAEVHQRQKQDAAAGHILLAPDDIHPNWDGQMMIARAVLDAMGYVEVKVPARIVDAPLPGLIPQWKVMRIDSKAADLTETTVAQLKPDAGWMTIKLPETEPIPDMDTNKHWLDGYRAQGASVALRQQPTGKFIGVASLSSDGKRAVQFHTGGDLHAVWLNGKKIYQNDSRHGYHIGRESAAAELRQGENTVVIETGPVFFLSVTEGAMWE